MFSIFVLNFYLRDLNIRISNCGKIFSDVHICEIDKLMYDVLRANFKILEKNFEFWED